MMNHYIIHNVSTWKIAPQATRAEMYEVNDLIEGVRPKIPHQRTEKHKSPYSVPP